jgi:hypothetical protein
VGQERAKQIDIWTEWKREIGNKLKKKTEKIKVKILNVKNPFNKSS